MLFARDAEVWIEVVGAEGSWTETRRRWIPLSSMEGGVVVVDAVGGVVHRTCSTRTSRPVSGWNVSVRSVAGARGGLEVGVG